MGRRRSPKRHPAVRRASRSPPPDLRCTRQFIQAMMNDSNRQSESFLSHVVRMASGRHSPGSSASLHRVRRRNKLKSLRWLLQCSGNCIADVAKILQDIQEAAEDGSLRNVSGASGATIRPVPTDGEEAHPGDVNVYDVMDDDGQCVAKIIHSPGRRSASLPRLDSVLRGVLGSTCESLRLDNGGACSVAHRQPAPPPTSNGSQLLQLRTSPLRSGNAKSCTDIGATRKEDQFTQTSESEAVGVGVFYSSTSHITTSGCFPLFYNPEMMSDVRPERSAYRKRPLESSPSDISPDKKMKMNFGNECVKQLSNFTQEIQYSLPNSYSNQMYVKSNDTEDGNENKVFENEETGSKNSTVITPLHNESAIRKVSRIPRIVNSKAGTPLNSQITRRYSEPVKSGIFKKSVENLKETTPVPLNTSPKYPLRSKSQRVPTIRECSPSKPREVSKSKSLMRSKSPVLLRDRKRSPIPQKHQQSTSVHSKAAVQKERNLSTLSQTSSKSKLLSRAKSCNPKFKQLSVVSNNNEIPNVSKPMICKQSPIKVNREKPTSSSSSPQESTGVKIPKLPRQSASSPVRIGVNHITIRSKSPNSSKNSDESGCSKAHVTSSVKAKSPNSPNSIHSRNSQNSRHTQNSPKKGRREPSLSGLITVVTPPTINSTKTSNVKRQGKIGSNESLLRVPRTYSVFKSISEHSRSVSKFSTMFDLCTPPSRPTTFSIHGSPSVAPSCTTYTIRSHTSLPEYKPEPPPSEQGTATRKDRSSSSEDPSSSSSSDTSEVLSVVYRPANTSDERLVHSGLRATSSQDTDLSVNTSNILPHMEDSRQDNDDTYDIDDTSADLRARRTAMQQNGQLRRESRQILGTLRDLVASVVRPGCGDCGQQMHRGPGPSDQELLLSQSPRTRLRRTYSGPLPRSAPCRYNQVQVQAPPREGLRTGPQDVQLGDIHHAIPVHSAPFEDTAPEQVQSGSRAVGYGNPLEDADRHVSFQQMIANASEASNPGTPPVDPTNQSPCNCVCRRVSRCTGLPTCRCVMHRRNLCQQEDCFNTGAMSQCCARYPQCVRTSFPAGIGLHPRMSNAARTPNGRCPARIRLGREEQEAMNESAGSQVSSDVYSFGRRSVGSFTMQRGNVRPKMIRRRITVQNELQCPDCLTEEDSVSQNDGESQPWSDIYNNPNNPLPIHNAGDCRRVNNQQVASNPSRPPCSRQTGRSVVGSYVSHSSASGGSHPENQINSFQQDSNPGAFGDRPAEYDEDSPKPVVPVPGRQNVIVRGPYSTWRCPISRLVKKKPPMPEEPPKPDIPDPVYPETPIPKARRRLCDIRRGNSVSPGATPFIFHGSKFYTNTPSRRNNGLQDDCKFFGYEWPFCDTDQWNQFRKGIIKPKHLHNT